MLRRLAPVACALLLGGCLQSCGDGDSPTRIRGNTLRVYSSLPRHGVSAPVARAVAAGERRALADAGGRAGRYRIRLVQLDSTRPDDRLWDPGMVDANAKRARDDPTTIAYLGELDYGASAVSVPVTNDAGILQVSPGDGLTSLTRAAPGRPREGPDRYYPSDRRTFLRLVPDDLLEVERLLDLARWAGVRRVAVVSDDNIYGRDLAVGFTARAAGAGMEIVGTEDLDGDDFDRATIQGVVGKLADARPDAVLLAGVAGAATAPLLADLGRRLSEVRLFAGSGLLAAGAKEGDAAMSDRLTALSAIRPVGEYPSSGRRLLRRLDPHARRVEALYGYEAMRLVVDAVREAGASRTGVVQAGLRPRTRRSVIGTYRVRRSGEVSEDRFAVYRLTGGRVGFERLVR